MQLDVNKLITLGNGEAYLVINKVVVGEEEFFYIAEADIQMKSIKDNYKIIKPDYKEESIFIEEVIGEDKLKSILPAFVRNSSNNL